MTEQVAKVLGADDVGSKPRSLITPPPSLSPRLHLKKVFDKLDVHNRSQLVARLFFDQYLPRFTSGIPVGGDGWFVTGSR